MAICVALAALSSPDSQAAGSGSRHQAHTGASALPHRVPVHRHAQPDAAMLPAITVQARRSTEKARDLPFTVNVSGEVELEQLRHGNLEDVLRGTPGVEVNSWGGVDSANVRIRGVGSLYQSGADDNSVIVNLDGVPTSVGNVGLGTLDIEQVEVLKGPQGTLYGRNSAAGAINLRSHQPVLGVREGSVRGEIGNQHQHLAEGVLNVPLGETVAARLALRHNARDYWYDNQTTGKPVSKPNDLAGRASLLWQPQAATRVLLRASSHRARAYQSAMLIRPYADRPWQALDADTSIDGNRQTIHQHALEVQHDLKRMRLTSVTTHERIERDDQNLTGREITRAWLGSDAINAQTKESRSRGWSQDLRLSSLPGNRQFWVAGVNVYRSDWTANQANMGTRQEHELSHDSDALYGEATWPLAGTPLKLTTGLRHTRERKGYDGHYSSPGATPDTRALKDSYTTGRLGLGWALSAQTNLYATLAHGHKSAGFNEFATSRNDSVPYRAGKVDTMELGVKHESADGRLRLEGALFTNRVRDDHLLAWDPATYASWMVNVDTRSRGLELNARWRADHGLTLSGGLVWLDASIRSHAVTNTPAGDVTAGNRLPDVPRLSALLSVQWQHSLPSFAGLDAPVLDAMLSVRHVGKRPNDPQNNFDLDSYRKIDLHLGINSGNTEIYLWGNNLLDARHELYGYYMSPTLQVGMPAPGRSVGLGVSYRF
ncbi:MAG: TonB-dependent receptor [Lautropia sp.]|nr:TonB-dependent receptor [Lautropia sp.]